MNGRAISFGPFRLLAAQRLLLEGEQPVRLGSRAFDILAALVERAGEVIEKEELIARAWPRTLVEEGNLKIQVRALRRALGDGQGGHRYIVAVPGRGYSFVAPVRREEQARAPLPLTIAPVGMHNLPLTVTRMIGREDAAAALLLQLLRERLMTIVGPGGIGKTTVALAVAERVIAGYEHGVWLVDLAPLGDPRLVPSAVATVLGLGIRLEDPLPGLVAVLRDKRMLLLLDNCEHVIGAVASLAAAVLSATPDISILATSREPLGVAGEREYRLGPLSSPQPSSRPTAAEAATFSAVQLFVERATAVVEDFMLTDANAPLVGEICRRLDGLPLAIEFAAPRVEALGVEGLAAHLDDSLPLSAVRRRTAVPRHRTMRTVIDWSYDLLSADEQPFFRALGVFTGGFTLEAAAVVADETRTDALERLADLVAKSLIVADLGGARSWFRLLDTTRAYAIEKLDESGERGVIVRRHAAYYRALFARAEGDVAARPRGEWLADYAREIDNLRAALDWALSPDGDGSVGVELTAAAVPLWLHLSLLTECRSRVKQALDALGTAGTPDPREEMRLWAALGTSTSEAPEMGAAFTKALDLAERQGDSKYQLRALAGLFFYHAGSCRYRAALPFAQTFQDLALRGADPCDRLSGERTIGMAKHILGDHISARRHLERALSQNVDAIHHAQDIIRSQNDVSVAARAFLARVLWMLGFPDQAMRTAEMCIEEAEASGHAISLCSALQQAACPIALWVGDLTAAARYTGMLLDHARQHGLPFWAEFGSRFQIVLAIKAGDRDGGLRLRQAGPERVAEPNLGFRTLTGLTEMAAALVQAGRIVEGLALVETGIALSDGGWATPELLRLKGEVLVLQSARAAAETAEDLFRQALGAACQQEARSWELRAATSLARLQRDQGRSVKAVTLLQPVYDRFTEGFDTADLIAAKQLLAELGDTTPD
jgi:predicted ATPase/DNA-binding winged helix-turn-helix (wHTH) protein